MALAIASGATPEQMGLQADGQALQFAGNFAEAIQLAATSSGANAGGLETR